MNDSCKSAESVDIHIHKAMKGANLHAVGTYSIYSLVARLSAPPYIVCKTGGKQPGESYHVFHSKADDMESSRNSLFTIRSSLA